jgi:hypothetical protein
MNPPPAPGLVLCEGKEDKLVIERLARESGIAVEAVAFESYDGESKLRSFLGALKVEGRFSSGELKRVLVTRDADDNPAGMWTSLSNAVNEVFGLAISAPGDWQQTAEGPSVAAWLIPGGGESGMIETLCMSAATGKARDVFPCLDSFQACLKALREGKDLHQKERFAYWTICGQDSDPRKRLSLERAIDHLEIDWGHQAFAGLKKMLVETAG